MVPKEIIFSEFLDGMCEICADAPAVTCEDVTVSFAQLRQGALRCALQLSRAGIGRGDKVALWGFNSIAWLISFLGITGAGATAVLMNYGLKGEDTAALMKSVGVDGLIVGPNAVVVVKPDAVGTIAASAGIPADRIFRDLDLAKAALDPAAPLPTEEDMAEYQALQTAMDPHDTQVIIYTTGTTSFPKAPQLSAYSILNDAYMAADRIFPDQDRVESTGLLALPLFHSYGLTVTFAFLSRGIHMILPPVLKPDILAKLIDTCQVRDMASVGAIYEMLTYLPDFDARVAGKLRHCVVGGGFETPVKMMRLENAFQGAKIINGYGQTECSPIISVASGEDRLEQRAVTVGRPLKGLDVKIWDREQGFVPQGTVGEVVVRGFCLMNGYYGLPEEKQAVDADGWLHTGDLGRFDEEGMLQLTGRIKDIIIRCGENISPLDVEKALLEEDEIREVKVLGAPHVVWGESVEACVILKDGATLDEDGLRQRLRLKLSSFKIPSHFFEFKVFPLNENGKLDQRTLKANMLNRLHTQVVMDELKMGMTIFSTTMKNQSYTIYPACALVCGLAERLGFGGKQVNRIRHGVEEMLTERVEKAYSESADIRMDVELLPQWLRLRFTDSGKLYRLDADENSLSAKIILANVDAYSARTNADGETEYCLDYQYEDEFDVKSYLMKHTKDIDRTGLKK